MRIDFTLPAVALDVNWLHLASAAAPGLGFGGGTVPVLLLGCDKLLSGIELVQPLSANKASVNANRYFIKSP